jgi:hypothetical protein
MSFITKLLGLDGVVEKGLELIDEAWTSDEEEADNKAKIIGAKTKAKSDLLNAYAPFKVAQRYLALIFTVLFAFIMLNGILGALYGGVDMENVTKAKEFANEMWLGEIMLTIISFYFGGGFIESINRKDKNK